MIRKSFFCISFLFASHFLFSQTATISGILKDGSNGEPLESANVVQPPTNGTQTDAKGFYELKVEPGTIMLVFSYVGLNPDTQTVKVKAGETKTLNITLGGAVELHQVVIGENKVGTKVQKTTQSVDIMKPRLLEANNITNMQGAVTKVPGVTVLDGQMAIRGGSGYAYGSGSRVLLVVDEMPLMTADRSEIKWAFIPVENVEQMEINKGASAMQYGSSALNGVLNVTTAYARDTPNTRFTFFYEGIGKPPVDSFQWWKRDGKFFSNPNTAGMSFLHKQKFGGVDFVLGGMLQGSQSYLSAENDYFTRFNTKVRYQPRKLQRLSVELAANVLYRKSGFQFFWLNAANPYTADGGVILNERYFYAYVDAKLRYMDRWNNQHKIYTRMYRQKNLEGLTEFWIFRSEYQFRHDFGKLVRLLAGVNNEHWWVKDGTLGTHQVDFGGGFLQAELTYKFFTFNAGVREEYVRLDSAIRPTIPVFRAGMNFEIRKYNYLRASFGQAFRVPSIAERFVDYQLAGIEIWPNRDIKPERGFTAEIGYKRSLKIGNWLGYFDACMFWTEFRDMIEFTFNSSYDSALHIYFQSQNVAHARIFGWELSTYGEGKIGPVDFTTLFGYTYFYGADLNDTLYGAGRDNRNVGGFLKNAFARFVLPTAKDRNVWDSLTSGMLRYRNPHQFKADFDFLIYNKYRFGTSFQYYAYMTRIDNVFEVVVKGVQTYRAEHRNKGDFYWDLRTGYDFNKNVTLNFLVKNVLNSYTIFRLAKPDRPRSFTVQLVVNFGGANKNTTNPQSLVGTM